MDLSSIGSVRQFFQETIQIPRNSEEASNDYTQRCLAIVEPLLCETALSREVDLENTEACPASLTTVVHFRTWARHQGCIMRPVVAVQVNDNDEDTNNDDDDADNEESEQNDGDDENLASNADPIADSILFARVIFHNTHSLRARSLLQNHLTAQNAQLQNVATAMASLLFLPLPVTVGIATMPLGNAMKHDNSKQKHRTAPTEMFPTLFSLLFAALQRFLSGT